VSLGYLVLELNHNDWSSLTSYLPKDSFYFESISVKSKERCIEQLGFLISLYPKKAKALISDIKKHPRILKMELEAEFKNNHKYFALIKIKARLDNSVTHILLRNNALQFKESIFEGKERWIILISENILENLIYDLTKICNIIYKKWIPIENFLSILNGSNLTKREIEILRKAYNEGYFEYPKRKNSIELANELGISKVALVQIIRKAMKKLIKKYLDFELDSIL
jgi:predicted DNA binding protein